MKKKMNKHQSTSFNKVLLVVLDGVGLREEKKGNALKAAQTPHLDYLFQNYPNTSLQASGLEVGLPKGIMGNSEVGHLCLGAGRNVRQDLIRINEAINHENLEKREAFQQLIKKAEESSNRIHLLGLLSDGQVHSSIEHTKYLVKIISKHKNIKIFLHLFMDGRDTPPDSGKKYLKEIEKLPNTLIASIQGRSFGMDRDSRWEKIESSYKAITGQQGYSKLSPYDFLKESYKSQLFDEFIPPTLFQQEGAIKKNDCVFFTNFRPDRTRELTLALTDSSFSHFNNSIRPHYFLCMTPYIQDEIDLPILFDKEPIQGGLSEALSNEGYKQFKIAETEKYAHVTYFFNGGQKLPFLHEEQVLIPSPRDIKTYDEKPEMSAIQVTDKLLEALAKPYHFYLVNFANCDMVGHTGNFAATVKAVETIDSCLKRLHDFLEKNDDIAMLVTADHGNCDQMLNNKNPHTAHTTSPVPFIFINRQVYQKKLTSNEENLALKDVSPTVLDLLGFETPKHMTGHPIFKREAANE